MHGWHDCGFLGWHDTHFALMSSFAQRRMIEDDDLFTLCMNERNRFLPSQVSSLNNPCQSDTGRHHTIHGFISRGALHREEICTRVPDHSPVIPWFPSLIPCQEDQSSKYITKASMDTTIRGYVLRITHFSCLNVFLFEYRLAI